MDITRLLEDVASYGYRVYTIPGGFALADPLDVDGWYLEAPTLREALLELVVNGPLDAPDDGPLYENTYTMEVS